MELLYNLKVLHILTQVLEAIKSPLLVKMLLVINHFLTYSDTIHVYPTPTIDIQISDSNICLNNNIVPSNST